MEKKVFSLLIQFLLLNLYLACVMELRRFAFCFLFFVFHQEGYTEDAQTL